METVRLSSKDWSHEPVSYARGFLERLRGLKMVAPGEAVLLETGSVHSFGIKQPFHAVGLDTDQVVVQVVTVRPQTAVTLRGCRYVLELPLDLEPPPVGTRLEVISA